MSAIVRSALLLPLAALLACGSNSPATPPGPSYLNLTGDWLFAYGNPSSSSPITQFEGSLQSSNGTVTGVLHAFDATNIVKCVPETQDLPATGTLSPAGNLVLTIPIASGTATVTATLTSDLQQFPTAANLANGVWQIVGGSCAMPTTSIFLTQFAPATGTYTGTLNVLTNNVPVPGTATTVTAVLNQSTIPTADGVFPLTGTITATGACSLTITIADGNVEGGGIGSLPFNSPPVTYSIYGGAINSTATTVSGTILPFNTCGNQFYSGTLTRQ